MGMVRRTVSAEKPVDLIYMGDGAHILVKPWERMISQQGDVDWFCFWLKGEEDADPAKAEQYARWRELRKLQDKNKAAGDKSPGTNELKVPQQLT